MKKILCLCVSLTLLLGSCTTSGTVPEENQGGPAQDDRITFNVGDGSGSVEARVTESEGNIYILSLAEAYDVPLYSALSAEGIEGIIYAVQSEETFALPPAFIIFNSDDTATLKCDSQLEAGTALTLEESNSRFDADTIANLTDQDSLIRLSGGSLREDYIYISSTLNQELVDEFGIGAVINLTGEDFETSLPCYEEDSLSEAFLFMIDNPGPFLIASNDGNERLLSAILLSSLMGARGDQIRASYAASIDTQGIEELRVVMERKVDECLLLLNGGSMPTDSQLLNLSTNYLNSNLGLAFSEIPSLRLALR